MNPIGVKGVRGQRIAKSMFREDQDFQFGRAAGAGLGGAALAYGVPRLRTTSNVVAYGRNNPSRAARTLANAADRTMKTAERTTAGLGTLTSRGLKHTATGRVGLKFPKSLRMGAVTFVGAEMVSHNVPIRQKVLRPVYGPPQTGGW